MLRRIKEIKGTEDILRKINSKRNFLNLDEDAGLDGNHISGIRAKTVYKKMIKGDKIMITAEEKEEIWYNLRVIGDVTIDDEKYKKILLETLLKLPAEIREKILDEVLFVFTSTYGTTCNLVFPFSPKKQQSVQKCIILNPALQEKEKKTDEGIQDTIAHEIAHIILNRFGSSDPNFEKEADDLIETWGFRRAYKEYTRFTFMREKKWL